MAFHSARAHATRRCAAAMIGVAYNMAICTPASDRAGLDERLRGLAGLDERRQDRGGVAASCWIQMPEFQQQVSLQPAHRAVSLGDVISKSLRISSSA